jgi:hypothetical protein
MQKLQLKTGSVCYTQEVTLLDYSAAAMHLVWSLDQQRQHHLYLIRNENS